MGLVFSAGLFLVLWYLAGLSSLVQQSAFFQ
jgi:hypothetical protein